MANNKNVVLNFPYSSFEEYEQRQEEVLKKVLSQILQQPKSEFPENLTRKQACEYLRISLSSLNNYTKEGYLKAYRVGKNRVIYKKSELDQALRSIENMPKKLKGRK